MTFSPQEQDIIKYGLQNGKTRAEVEKAISNFRSGVIPQKKVAETFMQRAGEVLSEAKTSIAQDISGRGESPITSGFQAAATASSVPLKLGYEALPQGAREKLSGVGKTIGKGFTALTDKIAATKLFKEIGEFEAQGLINRENAPELYNTIDALKISSASGEIAGNILIADTATKLTKAGIDVTKKAATKAVPIIKDVARGVKKVGGKIFEGKDSKILSIFTGEQQTAVESAIRNPTIADIGIRGGDAALRKAVQVGAESSLKAKTAFIKGQGEAVRKIVGSSVSKASRQEVLYKFVDELSKNKVTIKNGKLDFVTSKINANPGEVAKINSAYKAIRGWKDWSSVGVHELKQLVGQYTKFANEAGGSSKSPFLGQFYKYLDNTVRRSLSAKQAKAYGNLNKLFWENIDLFDDMVMAFNSGDPFTKLAQLFGSNKDSLRQVIDFYEKITGNKIAPIVAGRTLAESRPAAFGFLNPRQWVDFFIDPKTQGSVVTRYGKWKK